VIRANRAPVPRSQSQSQLQEARHESYADARGGCRRVDDGARRTSHGPGTGADAGTHAAPKPCSNCGTVQSINYVEEKGQGSGLGMIAGGVVGGVLGHQIGSGRGNTVATVAGAAGGAYVGNESRRTRRRSRTTTS
jgi:hypothetical protein